MKPSSGFTGESFYVSEEGDDVVARRLFDLEDLANRLQQHLSGQPLSAAWAELPPEFILVARAMGPAELLDYARRRIMGLVLEEGSPTAHVYVSTFSRTTRESPGLQAAASSTRYFLPGE